jgi:hypothetical protein
LGLTHLTDFDFYKQQRKHMTYLNLTTDTVMLDDGSKVSTTFYDLIKIHVIECSDSFDLQKPYIIDDILSKDLVSLLTPTAASKIGKAFERMVENYEVPYVEFKPDPEYCTLYLLMPSALSL